jgi:hypothetical protein
MTQPGPPPPPALPPPAVPALPPPPAPATTVIAPAAQREPPPKQDYNLICFEGRPYECGSVFVLEIAGRWGSADAWTIDAGLLINAGPYALGGTFGGIAYDTEGNPTGEGSAMYKARFRRYLGDDGFAADLGLGYGDHVETAELAIGIRDLIAVTASAQTVRNDPDREYGVNVGVRIGAETIGLLVELVLHAAARK